MSELVLCKSRRELSNETFIAQKIGVDAAKNELPEVSWKLGVHLAISGVICTASAGEFLKRGMGFRCWSSADAWKVKMLHDRLLNCRAYKAKYASSSATFEMNGVCASVLFCYSKLVAFSGQRKPSTAVGVRLQPAQARFDGETLKNTSRLH